MIPPPGKPLDFLVWARLVHRHVRRLLPDVQVEATADSVVWMYQGKRSTLTRDRECWYLCHRAGRTTHGPDTVDAHRHDAHTAGVAARNIAGFFEVRFAIERGTAGNASPGKS